ncbi:unnamed protein product [Auanema sp. JU1783]|nr:unnamed protein product [Auanema sp. JU1783]
MDHSAHHHHDHASPNENSVNHMGHAMSFHFGKMETILFDFWMPNSVAGMVLSCVAILITCFIMETIRWLRQYRSVQKSLSSDVTPEQRLRLNPTFTSSSIFESFLHFVQLFLSYCLMLIFMTFNVWLCLAVVFGEVLSRLFFQILFPFLEHTSSSCGN